MLTATLLLSCLSLTAGYGIFDSVAGSMEERWGNWLCIIWPLAAEVSVGRCFPWRLTSVSTMSPSLKTIKTSTHAAPKNRRVATLDLQRWALEFRLQCNFFSYSRHCGWVPSLGWTGAGEWYACLQDRASWAGLQGANRSLRGTSGSKLLSVIVMLVGIIIIIKNLWKKRFVLHVLVVYSYFLWMLNI